jgi:asparagine synthase (glutamine-hydrolysing)
MFDLCAITGKACETPAPLNHRNYSKECRRSDVRVWIQGDGPVDRLVFDDPEVTLVCCADLFGSESSTNVAAYLAKFYREKGDGFVSELRGTFAIILYDHNCHTLKAWTDHFGAERLVFAESEGSLAIGTNIRSVLTLLGKRPIVSPAAIQEYLQYTCIPTPKTIYQGISKLPPGHQLISRPATRTRPYWDLAYREDHDPRRSESVWANETRDAVRSAVALSLTDLREPDMPGCFLSGGMDSSSVAGLVAQVIAQPPRTFSIGFDDPRYNEIYYARIVARHFSADHHEYFVKPQDIPLLALRAAQVYDEPFGNSSIVPTYHCARLAAEHGVTHLLAGDGGDELFGGNARYAGDRVFQRYGRIPRWMREWVVEPAVSRAARWTNLRFFNLAASYVRRSKVPVPDRYFSYSLIGSAPRRELFTSDFLTAVCDHDSIATARTHFYRAPAQSELNRWLYLDLKITIADNDLRKVMVMSRLAGVTPRFPLLNPTLAEFTGRIPVDLKVCGSQLRRLFKKAMADLLPAEIITKTKHGFGLPYSVWLADSRPLREFTFDVLGTARCRQRGYFRPGLLEWIWSQYESVHRRYYGEILWLLLMLELWHVMHEETLNGFGKPSQAGRATWPTQVAASQLT